MVLYESRKKELATEFGEGEKKCITDNSWMKASLQSLQGMFKIFTEDMEFLYKDRTFCLKDVVEVQTKQGVVINAGGIKANVSIGGNLVGTTDSIIDLDVGPYTATISKTKYVSQDISFVVSEGNYNEKYITLVKEPDTTEVEPPVVVGAILRATLREGSTTEPKPPILGEENWYGWEFENVGDSKWQGMVGVKITDETGNVFRYAGDSTIKQSVLAGEIKKLWVKCVVTGINTTEKLDTRALLTKTN